MSWSISDQSAQQSHRSTKPTAVGTLFIEITNKKALHTNGPLHSQECVSGTFSRCAVDELGRLDNIPSTWCILGYQTPPYPDKTQGQPFRLFPLSGSTDRGSDVTVHKIGQTVNPPPRQSDLKGLCLPLRSKTTNTSIHCKKHQFSTIKHNALYSYSTPHCPPWEGQDPDEIEEKIPVNSEQNRDSTCSDRTP